MLLLLTTLITTDAANLKPPVPGTRYRIGGLAIRGAADFMKRWEPTYATYLNETVGKALNISFEAVPMNFAETFDLVRLHAIATLPLPPTPAKHSQGPGTVWPRKADQDC